MPIVLTELVDAEPSVCDPCFRVAPTTATYEGCPVLVRRRAVVSQRGVAATVRWPLRFPDGRTVDLSACVNHVRGRLRFQGVSNIDQCRSVSVSTSSAVSTSLICDDSADAISLGLLKVRILTCDGRGDVWEVAGVTDDPVEGIVEFVIPPAVADVAGIYLVQIGVVDIDERPLFVEKGLLSIEPTAWGDACRNNNIPTLGELRLHLKDTAVENELLGEAQFSPEEMLTALMRPIAQWNETPPDVVRYNCGSFPHRYHWMQAAVGELLASAAQNYIRNEYQATHGGVSGNFKAKARAYTELAERYGLEWRRFIRAKKAEVNAALWSGTWSGDWQ